MNTGLIGCNILIARPESAARNLVMEIAAHSGTSICMPLFAIEPLLTADLLLELKQALDHCDIAIFISRNAAEILLPYADPSSPIRWACIGPTTAQFLRQAGFVNVISPAQAPFDSHTLLEEFARQRITLVDSKVLIITGLDGDFWLRQALLDNHAIVQLLAVYKRIMPQVNLAFFSDLLGQQRQIDIILTTCVTSLINLHNLAAQTKIQVQDLPLLVVSARIAKHAIEMGHRNVYTSASMSDQDIMRALLDWRVLNV